MALELLDPWTQTLTNEARADVLADLLLKIGPIAGTEDQSSRLLSTTVSARRRDVACSHNSKSKGLRNPESAIVEDWSVLAASREGTARRLW